MEISSSVTRRAKSVTRTERSCHVLAQSAELLEAIDETSVQLCVTAVLDAMHRGATIFAFGNGGSATTAGHLSCDLTNLVRYFKTRAPQAYSLTEPGVLTAIANDYSYEDVFALPLSVRASKGDVLIAISVSGTSSNVIKALELGRLLGTTNIGLLGRCGGDALPLCDASVVVDSSNFGIVESIHLAVIHQIVESVKDHAIGEQ